MKTQIMGKDGLKTVNLNRRKASHERCLNCSGWHTKEVADCPFNDCLLYPFRTGDGKQDAEARSRAIRDYCMWCSNGQVGEVTKCPSNNCPLYMYRKGALDKAINTPSFEKFDHIDGNFKTNITNGKDNYRFRKCA